MSQPSSTGFLDVLAQLRSLWQRQSAGRRSLAILVLLGVIGVVVYTTVIRRPAAWTSVAESASPDDAQEIYATLQARDIPVRLRDGKAEVPAERADEARAIASAAGLPRTGKGFELFDKTSLGQSSFSEQINYRRALQGELSRSIATLAQVEGARVHLALGKRSVFKDRDEAASASVAVRLHAGQVITIDQVRGIRQLVAASVDGMKPESVVIVDNHGNLLDANDASGTDRKAAIEQSVTARVRTMLERVVGIGKVSVVTAADVDERQVNETQELYDPQTPALRSESRIVDGGNPTATTSGIAGTRGNLPGAPAPTTTPPAAASTTTTTATMPGQHIQETKNYELTHTVRQTTKPDVVLTKLHLAVLIDFKPGPDGKPVARTEPELVELRAIARRAAGIDDTRGDQIELRAIPFAADPELDPITPVVAPAGLPIIPVAIGAGGMLVAFILLMVVFRRRKRGDTGSQNLLALPVPIGELERALAQRALPNGQVGSLQPALPAGPTVRDRVLETVRGDVERTAGVLSGWLATPAAGASKVPAPKAAS